jgi:hypothetical protein
MNHKRIIWWIIAWGLLLPFNQATACSPRLIGMSCAASAELISATSECANEVCSIKLTQDKSSKSVFVDDEEVATLSESGWISLNAWNKPSIDIVDAICAADLEGSQSLRAFYLDWNPREDANLRIDNYSIEQENSLIAIKADYLSCWDVNYVSDGNSIAQVEATRSYCSASTPILPCGSRIRISPILFAGFVFSNPSLETLPYILAYLGVFTIIGGGAFLLHRQGQLALFLVPTKIHTIALGFGLPILFCLGIFLIPYLVYVLVGYYLLVSMVSYLITTRVSKT